MVPCFIYCDTEELLHDFPGVPVGTATLDGFALLEKDGKICLMEDTESQVWGELRQMPEAGWERLLEAFGEENRIDIAVTFWQEPTMSETFISLPFSRSSLRRFLRKIGAPPPQIQV